jgi:hypothetical protein
VRGPRAPHGTARPPIVAMVASRSQSTNSCFVCWSYTVRLGPVSRLQSSLDFYLCAVLHTSNYSDRCQTAEQMSDGHRTEAVGNVLAASVRDS